MISRKLWIGVGCALAVGLLAGGGVVAYVELSDDSAEVVQRELAASHRAVEQTISRAARAERIDDVRAAGRQASSKAADIQQRLDSLVEVKDERYRDAAREALSADVALLSALGQLAEIDPLTLTDDWSVIEDALAAARLRLEQAGERVEALELEQALSLPTQSLTASTAALEELITTAHGKLSGWRRRVARVKRKQREDRGVLRSYASSMCTHLGRYGELRDQLSDWIGKVDSEGASFQEVYDFLGTASSDRASVREGIAMLDPPASMASAHTRLVGVIDQAIGAVDSGYSGIVEYEFDFEEEFADYKDTPGWRQFSSASDRIADEYQAARGAWDAAVTNEDQSIKSRRLPRRPNV